MEGGFPFGGGDPEDLLRGLREFAEQQAETVQEAQREQFATLTLSTAVELTSAALSQVQVTGTVDEQAVALRDAMRVLFPEAVALVTTAKQALAACGPFGFMPRYEDLNWNGLGFSKDRYRRISDIDAAEGLTEAEDQSEHFKIFGDRLPAALETERKDLIRRLKTAPPVWTAG